MFLGNHPSAAARAQDQVPDDVRLIDMNGNVVQKIGEELYYRVKCSSAVTKGQVVMFTGTLGASGGLTAAPATGLTPTQANYILGVATESGATNAWIFVTTFGEVRHINSLLRDRMASMAKENGQVFRAILQIGAARQIYEAEKERRKE